MVASIPTRLGEHRLKDSFDISQFYLFYSRKRLIVPFFLKQECRWVPIALTMYDWLTQAFFHLSPL